MPKINDMGKSSLGIDPGEGGGIALIGSEGENVFPRTWGPRAKTVQEFWEQLSFIGENNSHIVVAVEEQRMRPTTYRDRTGVWHSSVLKSTGVLYGSYREAVAFMVAKGVRYEVVTPQRWQKALGIPPRKKSEGKTAWKNRLKDHAKRLFPNVKMTLAVADAFLLAEYARRTL